MQQKSYTVVASNNTELIEKLNEKFEGIINIENNTRDCLQVKRDKLGTINSFLYRYKGQVFLKKSITRCQNTPCYNSIIEGRIAFWKGKTVCQSCYKYLKKISKSKKNMLLFIFVFFLISSVSASRIDLEYNKIWEINSTEVVKITIVDDENNTLEIENMDIDFNNTYLISNMTMQKSAGKYEKLFFIKNITGMTNITFSYINFIETIEIEVVEHLKDNKDRYEFIKNLNKRFEQIFDTSGFVILVTMLLITFFVIIVIFIIILKLSKREEVGEE